jgi:hypothetical protein
MPIMPCSALYEHPMNSKIYFTDLEADQELMESIQESGIIHPIIATPKGCILSGNRRYRCAIQLGMNTVPVEYKEFDSVDEEFEFLLLSNQYRIKTMEEKIREGIKLKEILSRRGERTRDAVGKTLHMSGRTFDKGEAVIAAIDSLQSSDPERANKLRDRLNRSVHGAYNDAKDVEINDDDDVETVEAELRDEIENIEERKKYAYLDDLYRLLSFMDAIYNKMAKGRNSTTPESVGHMIGNIAEMKERLATWIPKNMITCSNCHGTGQVTTKNRNGEDTVINCHVCVDGKTGLYKASAK